MQENSQISNSLVSQNLDSEDHTIIKPYISLDNSILGETNSSPLIKAKKRSKPEDNFMENDQSSTDSVQDTSVANSDNFNTGEWSPSEHALFLEAIAKYGNKWNKVQEMIKTRSTIQVRSHSQKYFAQQRSKALKKLKIEGKEKQCVFLVTREYRNLNHIIQRNPIEIYVDPLLHSKSSKKSENTKVNITETDSLCKSPRELEIKELKSIDPIMDHADGRLDCKFNETLIYNNAIPIIEDNQNEDNYDNQEYTHGAIYASVSLPFSSSFTEINYDQQFMQQPEVNGFLSKISYEYN